MDLEKSILISRRSTAWLIAEYAARERRQELIERYNLVIGKPSMAVARVHDDFLKDRMEASELVAFVSVCEGLIVASKQCRSCGS